MRPTLSCAALLALVLALPTSAAAPGRRAGKPSHPDVAAQQGVQACDECHRQATPEVVREWDESRHGTALVKCMVCHGSTGKDFTLVATSDRCRACHADEVASVTPARGKPAICFACHAPHRLAATGRANPHQK